MMSDFCCGAVATSNDVAAEIEAGMVSMGPMGVVICLTVLIYRDILAEGWADLARHAQRLEEAVSEIEGATHFLDLVRLAKLLPAARSCQVEASAIAEAMARPSVAFAMQHAPRYLMIAGDALAALGARDSARANYTEALTGGPFGSQQWLRAELLRRLGDIAEDDEVAEGFYHQALEVAAEQGATLFELRAAMGLARLWRGQGRPTEATSLLGAVCVRLNEEGPDLTEAKAMLAEDAAAPQARASSTAVITT
jgi:tetratricopeptide (TPR) repeat protein